MAKRSESGTEDTAGTEGAASVAPHPERHDSDGTTNPAVFLIEELPAGFKLPASNDNDVPTDNTSVVYIARVRDTERLLEEKGLGVHRDAVDALTDLVLQVMETDDDGQGKDR